VTGTGHSALQLVLESLATLEIPAPAPPPLLAARPVPAQFVHETTEDEKFTGRADALARLDRWAADPSVRLIAITAIGGLGKTALIGRWLRQARQCEGLFFWSFYRDREAQRFFEALLAFAREQLGFKPRDDRAAPRVQACELLASRRLMVALDGLEVIQEVPGTVAYGKLLNIELGEFLHCHCRAQGTSLVLLTSRFPFPDLWPYLGGSLRSLPLPALEPEEGAALLAVLGLGGRPADREEISRRLFGHPLALRLFARSAPPHMLGDPTRLWHTVFDQPHLAADDSLEGKVRRLLTFYEASLPEAQCQALALVALFRAPVGEATLAPLWEKLLGKPSADASLREALNQLRHERLLTDDPGEDGRPRYACHPILRDHFRARLLRQPGFAREAAGLLAGPPDAPMTRSLEAIQIVAAAVEVLLEAGELKGADDIYVSRFEGGDLFKSLPAPHWGMDVARGFVRDEARRQALAQKLGLWHLGFYLNEVGRFADLAGEPETALEFYAEGITLTRRQNDNKNLSTGLDNLGLTEVSLGLLAQAASHFTEALDLAKGIDDEEGKLHGLASTGYTASLRGDVERPDAAFSQANAIENRIHPGNADLYRLRGVQWAEHLLRIGALDLARRLTEANWKISEQKRRQQDVARCEWILGWVDTLAGRRTDAHGHLDRAKATFTAGHMIYDLARVFVTESACFLGQGQCESALAACERALQLAAPRNYRLLHADALNLRAQAALESAGPHPASARDDAEAALQLAEFCEYAWAQRDALELLARAHHQLGNPAEALRCGERAADWNRRLKRA
jgi:tetratricopeptide (TPR) repeat protein